MNTRDPFTRNNLGYKRTTSLDFLRHLCVATRLKRSSTSHRPSRRVSEPEATRHPRQTGQESCDGSKKWNVTLGRLLSIEIQMPLKKVYKMDQTFHRNWATWIKCLQRMVCLFHHIGRIDAVPTNSDPYQIDYETRSFCDSLSSITCSNFAKSDVGRNKIWTKYDRKFPDKTAKFQAIEKWLQNLPEPALKPGSEKFHKL